MKATEQVDDRLLRLCALLSDEWRRREADQATAERPREEPKPFVDITPWASLSDKDVARRLGAARKQEVDLLAEHVNDERSGAYRRAVPPGFVRCEAGQKQKRLLRCPRAVPADARWCWQHHPLPPRPLPRAARLDEWDLRLRPDGELIRAVYAQTDRSDHLAGLVNAALAQIERQEARATVAKPQPLLTVTQVAELLGVTARTVYDMVKGARIPFLRVNSGLRFRPEDIDEWLARQVHGPVRRKRR